MKYLVVGSLLFGVFIFRFEFVEYWEKNQTTKVGLPQDLSKIEIENKLKNLKAQILDLNKNLELKKNEGLEKIKNIKDAIDQAEKSAKELQAAMQNLQDSGQNLRKSIVGAQ